MWLREDRYATFYDTVEVIGEGSLGIVAKVERKSNKQLYAMKSIMFSRVNKWMETELLNEIDILRDLDHPNIVRPQEVTVAASLCNVAAHSRLCNVGIQRETANLLGYGPL